MPLINRNNWPPGGFPYFEPKLNWWAPKDGLSFRAKATQIQKVRIANPGSGLDPSLEACEQALDEYVCLDLKKRGLADAWCIGASNPVMVTAINSRKVGGCGGCGARRAR